MPSDDRQSRPARPTPAADAARNRRLRDAIIGFRTRFAKRRSRAAAHDATHELHRADTPADVGSVRAKSSRHRKSTADKWNQ